MGAVRFLKPWSLYNPGETAGFDDETTAVLINSGTAVSLEDAKKADKAAAKAQANAEKAAAEAAAKAAADAEATAMAKAAAEAASKA